MQARPACESSSSMQLQKWYQCENEAMTQHEGSILKLALTLVKQPSLPQYQDCQTVKSTCKFDFGRCRLTSRWLRVLRDAYVIRAELAQLILARLNSQCACTRESVGGSRYRELSRSRHTERSNVKASAGSCWKMSGRVRKRHAMKVAHITEPNNSTMDLAICTPQRSTFKWRG